MTTLKTSYKSVAMLVDAEGKQIKFDTRKADGFVKNRQLLVNGEWCNLFAIAVTKTASAIGVQLRGVTLEGTATRVVEPVATSSEPKSAPVLADPTEICADLA
jgi:hypothetical protein